MSENVRNKFIKVRATAAEKEEANRIAGAVGKDLSEIFRSHLRNLSNRPRVRDLLKEAKQ